MPVKVRIEGHEELLRGSFHAEDPHYTTSPTQAYQRRRALRVRFSGVGHVHVIGKMRHAVPSMGRIGKKGFEEEATE